MSNDPSLVHVKIMHVLHYKVEVSRTSMKWEQTVEALRRPTAAEGSAERTTNCRTCGATLVVRVHSRRRAVIGRLIHLTLAISALVAVVLMIQYAIAHADDSGTSDMVATLQVSGFFACLIALITFTSLAVTWDGARLDGRLAADGKAKDSAAPSQIYGIRRSRIRTHDVASTGRQFGIDLGLDLTD